MATLSPVGYTDTPKTYDEFASLVQIAQDASNGSCWALGDLYNLGEEHFSDVYAQAFDETKKTIRTIKNYASVARKFSVSRRRASLSFSHHDVVKALDESKADEWLDKAEAKKYNRNDFREKVYGEGNKPTKTQCKVIDLVDHLIKDYGLTEDTIVDISFKIAELEAA